MQIHKRADDLEWQRSRFAIAEPSMHCMTSVDFCMLVELSNSMPDFSS